VLIDEAGQASPQYCVGALWRAKRAVIVGDPIQLEPVVGVPEELVGPLQAHCGTHQRYVPPKASAQTMADLSNRYGTYLNESDADNRLWLGSPLVVHRRCISPMFEIANAIAYENKMVYGGDKDQLGTGVPCSQWIDVSADDNDGHWIPSQGERVVRIVKKLVGSELRNSEGKLRAFVITPFSKVAEKITDLLAREFSWKDAKEMCGTVHTFQGKEADFVVFLLGGDPKKPGVISSFAGKNPNLVNVAVTRAKKRLYVVGNRKYWTGRTDTHGYYGHTAEVLGKHRETVQAAQSGLVESAGKSCATT
jgi:superfamily I DNA and/or RNA helicase